MPGADQIQIENPFLSLTEMAKAMKKDQKYRWPGYEHAKKHAKELEPHVFGEIPSDLIDMQRPNEPEAIKEYRKSVWQSVTKSRFEKIYTVFKRIFTPHNYTITFKENPTGVTAGNEPEKYFTEGYTETGSVLNYTKDILLRMAFGDPGAVLSLYDVMPEQAGGYSTVRPVLYEAERVWWYSPGEAIVLEAYEKSNVTVNKKTVDEGLVLIVITPTETTKVYQTGEKKDDIFSAEIIETREKPYMPARMLKGISTVTEDGIIWQQSFVAGIVPDWNKAIQLITDLDGYTVVHLYPKYVQIDLPCNVCHGSKTEIIDSSTGETGKCHSCKGTGIQAGGTGPYASLQIPRDQVGKLGINDIAGFISPPDNIIETVRKQIDAYFDAGFAAMNMEVVGVSQANTSAEKVALDRQDLNQTLTDVMFWAFDLLMWQYFTIGSIRYGGIVSDVQKEVVPDITRPVSFDYSTVDSIIRELTAAKDAALPVPIIAQLQRRSAGILFGNESEESRRVLVEMQLDPLPGITPDGILALQSTGVIDPIDFYIHAKISVLAEIAFEENPKFFELPLSEKRAIIERLATARMPKPKPDPMPIA